MSRGLVYCHICGRILLRSENMQIVQRNFDTKKEKMLFDLCQGCLDSIKAMEIPKDSLVLRTSEGKRFWTEKQISDFVFASWLNSCKALKNLYYYQTDEEKRTRETKYDNNVGFNKPDSNFLTGMSKKYIALEERITSQGKEVEELDVELEFTDAQMEAIQHKLEKYIGQLTTIANA